MMDGAITDAGADTSETSVSVDAGSDASQCRAPAGPAVPRTTTFDPMQPMDDMLRINHIQSEGTHNSYHQRPAAVIPEWDYQHAPLDIQLESQGVRQFELDVHWNVDCQYHEVYHVPRFDDRTSCRVFTDCLQTIRQWSDAHPGHHPIFIMIEPKDAFPGNGLAQIRLDALDREILAVFPRELVVTPDEVKGTSATLDQAVTTRGWPTLRASRGRVLFFMNDTADWRRVYTHENRDVDGRMIFAESLAGDPFSAVRVLNGAIASQANIRAAAQAGYLVRTFAETNADAARMGDRTAFEAGLAAGAHMLSTDYPVPTSGIQFYVEIPMGTPSRCNPITSPVGCTPTAIENPARLSP